MTDILSRKQDHIDLSLDPGSQISSHSKNFADYKLPHCALPDIDFEDVDITFECFGKVLKAPVFIASMTGGLEAGAKINRHLAEAAQELGLAMGLGSQRVTLEHPETLASFQVRSVAPDILLMANLGAVQLNLGYGPQECSQIVEQVGADGLYLHLNSLQEAVQPGGDLAFKNLSERIVSVVTELDFPVIVKECGNGLDANTIKKLKNSPLKGFEISGHGGTSWGWIEAQRHPDARLQRLGNTFAQWGWPTPLAIQAGRHVYDGLIIGSGGIRTGVDAAVAIALGADAVSIAQPVLKAALTSTQAVIDELQTFILELKIAMFCCGAQNLSALRKLNVQCSP